MTHAELEVGQWTWFDVRGERIGKITRIFQVDGVTYCALLSKTKAGFVEGFQRVGLARIYPNMPLPAVLPQLCPETTDAEHGRNLAATYWAEVAGDHRDRLTKGLGL